ncbi:MAG: PIN domain nuclease [Oscillospiraceae bacterium]|jgi:predicted nucleic acid-binding protein|nr:PIN domain nuclease [Oscillospiraceae bacterium]
MKRLKIYLDTSVISHLDAPDAPDQQEDTFELWEKLKAGEYDIVVSDATMDEIDRCNEPKYSYLMSELAKISIEDAEKTIEAMRLRDLYLAIGGLPKKSDVDALHLAIATVYNCDIVLSWNFKHIVNYRAMTAVEAVNTREGYKPIRILSPTMMKEV